MLLILTMGCGPDTQEDPLPTLDELDLLGFEWEQPAAGPSTTTPASYTVARGDTLFSIARRFGLDVTEIKLRNELTSDVLRPGMVLALGGDVAAEASLPAAGVKGPAGAQGYQWPVKGPVVQRYSPLHGRRGIDISAARGTSVGAARDGRVVFRSFLPGLGQVVILEHQFQFLTLYGHLSSIRVNCGNRVSRGQVIGRVGSSGNAASPRLHLRVYVNYRNTKDPMAYLP